MEPLDVLYRHEGATLTWDGDGVTVTRAADDLGATARWDQIAGARQVGVGPGYVQLLVHGHEPPLLYRDDSFALPVSSDQDAQRLVTSIAWHSGATIKPTRPVSVWHERLRAAFHFGRGERATATDA